MNRSDALWVGLKLLGVYLLVNGAVEANWSLFELARPERSSSSSFSFSRELAYRELLRGGGFVAAGLALIFGAGLFVRMTGERHPVPSPPPPDTHP
jgi:hypothetical protein